MLDTNILIYAIDEDSKYFKGSHPLLYKKDVELFTTSKNISEFLSVVTRFPGNSLSLQEALLVVEDYKKITTILYPSDRSLSILL